MSDLGLLSYQYQELANLARQLKRWAVRVKCARYNLPVPDEDLEGLDLPTSMKELGRITRFLKDVIACEDEGAWPEHWLSEPPLPTVLVERLRVTHALDLPLYGRQLARLSDRLQKGIEALTDKDVDLLDGIVLAADADANAVFRRLMRWT